MSMSDRQIVKIIREICEENNISFKLYCYDWVMQLEINNKSVYIFGYQFQNNSAPAHLICEDKSALSEILEQHNIRAVKHHFFMCPSGRHHIGTHDCWTELIGLLDKYGSVVCKRNDGTGGNEVYKAETRHELEIAIDALFKTNRSVAVSPYYDIETEYRVIILDGGAELVYSKERMFVEGTGVDDMQQLIIKKYGTSVNLLAVDKKLDYNIILEKGEKYNLTWKHNLAKGAEPIILHDEKERERLTDIALSAAAVTGINFASVDIIKTVRGEYLILEINSGIMMEQFAKHSEENYITAKKIYKKALKI